MIEEREKAYKIGRQYYEKEYKKRIRWMQK